MFELFIVLYSFLLALTLQEPTTNSKLISFLQRSFLFKRLIIPEVSLDIIKKNAFDYQESSLEGYS